MSSSKLDTSGVFQPVIVRGQETKLSLPTQAVRFRVNGIEFLSPKPVSLWAEMTVDLVSPADRRKIHGNGVVVACSGNRHSGYLVSVIFMNLNRQSQEHLSLLASSQAA